MLIKLMVAEFRVFVYCNNWESYTDIANGHCMNFWFLHGVLPATCNCAELINRV